MQIIRGAEEEQIQSQAFSTLGEDMACIYSALHRPNIKDARRIVDLDITGIFFKSVVG